RVAVVALVEGAFAANGRNAEAIPVMRNARDYALKQPRVPRTGFRIVQLPKAKRVHHCNGPRAHREDVAQDAAYTCCRALKRLDKARVVMRFDFERDRHAVADIDDAGVLTRTLQYVLASRGKLLQVHARALIGTMLAPHHAEDSQFCEAGFPS